MPLPNRTVLDPSECPDNSAGLSPSATDAHGFGYSCKKSLVGTRGLGTSQDNSVHELEDQRLCIFFHLWVFQTVLKGDICDGH